MRITCRGGAFVKYPGQAYQGVQGGISGPCPFQEPRWPASGAPAVERRIPASGLAHPPDHIPRAARRHKEDTSMRDKDAPTRPELRGCFQNRPPAPRSNASWRTRLRLSHRIVVLRAARNQLSKPADNCTRNPPTKQAIFLIISSIGGCMDLAQQVQTPPLPPLTSSLSRHLRRPAFLP